MRLSKIFPIILLPTKCERSNIWMNEKGELRYSSIYSLGPPSKSAKWIPYELYVYSKEIACNAGEWHYDSIRKVITRTATKIPNPNTCFKIVAFGQSFSNHSDFRIPDEFVTQYVKSYRKGNIINEIDIDVVPDDKGIFKIDKYLENGDSALFNFRKNGYNFIITSLCPENTKITKEMIERNRIIHIITDVIQKGTETVPEWMIDQVSEQIYDTLNAEFHIIKKPNI